MPSDQAVALYNQPSLGPIDGLDMNGPTDLGPDDWPHDIVRLKYSRMSKPELIRDLINLSKDNYQLRQKDERMTLFLRRKWCIEDDEQLLMEMQKLEKNANRQQHLTFMFASPLVIERQDSDDYIEIDQLDCRGEWAQLSKALADKHKAIKIRKICGTLPNLRLILEEGTLVLHFSGHG